MTALYPSAPGSTLRAARPPAGNLCIFSSEMQTAPHPHPESRSAAGRRKAGFPVSAGPVGLLLDLLGVFPKRPLALGRLPKEGRGHRGRRRGPTPAEATQRPPARHNSNGPRRRRSLLTSRYPPWCWRHARRPGPRREGPGVAGLRPGGSPRASPRVGQGRLTQAQGGAAKIAGPRARG